MTKSILKVLMTAACCLVFVVSRVTAESGEDQRHWRWMGVWIEPDCEYVCDPVAAGCATDPDCKCECYQ